jgi:putative ABC transport system substrate-binding protein
MRLTVRWRRSPNRCGELIRRLASYVDRIRKGAQPGELPTKQPTTFRAVDQPEDGRSARHRAVRALLLRADEVIE